MLHNRQNLLLGAHMSTAGGFEKAILRGESIGCTAIQIFTKNNRQWKARPLAENEAILFKETQKNSSIASVIAHASYLINIGSSQKIIEEKSRTALIHELERCFQLGIPYLVLHPGSHIHDTIETCLERIAYNLDIVLSRVPQVTILLENSAGQGSNVGSTFEQLAYIKNKASTRDRIQFCFDTCHAFAAGYDFRTPQTYAALWQHYDAILGIENLKAIHVNDSKKELGSSVDRHENIGEGKLGLGAFELLCNDDRLFAIPKILETPKMESLKEDKKNLDILKGVLTEATRKILSIR